jgi:hypothetical protein
MGLEIEYCEILLESCFEIMRRLSVCICKIVMLDTIIYNNYASLKHLILFTQYSRIKAAGLNDLC